MAREDWWEADMADGAARRQADKDDRLCVECGLADGTCTCDQCGGQLCSSCKAPSLVRVVCESCWDPELDGGITDHD
jgi:hypothetical protein